MKIGDLPRASSTPAGSRGNLSIWVAVFLLASSVLVAGSLALPPPERTDGSAEGAKATTDRVAGGWTRPASPPDRVSPVQMANADPVEVYAAPAAIEPAAPQPDLDEEPAGAPAHTGSNAVPAPDQPREATAPKPPEAAPVAVAAVPEAAGAKPGPALQPDPANRLVDLNSASVQELNALRGGGLIGKAIARGRPYSSVEDLVKKRVLNRTVYGRIKDQVTVR